MLKIITHPNPILRQKAKPIKNTADPELQKLIPELAELMLKSDGLGIAAPQVAKSIRLIIVRYKDGTLAMVNPKITSRSLLKEIDEEGCLSVPNMFGQVKRCKKITVKYQDERGKIHKLSGQGLLARVIQHETDHLDGVLFIDKAKNLRKINE